MNTITLICIVHVQYQINNKQNIQSKCTTCNFEAKSMSGLKTHEKTQHKIQCESCEFRSTTQILLKKHAKNLHWRKCAIIVLLITFPVMGPAT